MRHIFTPILALLTISYGFTQQIVPGTELKNYHPIKIEFTDVGETYNETTGTNPFTDRRLNVTFTSPSSAVYVVPGYFAADGDAAETSATSGNKWHVKFTPDEVGTWTYSASFRQGSNVAIVTPQSPSDGTANSPIDGQSGSFSISATDKTGKDFRGKGKLEYIGERYMRWSGTGEYFLEFGADSPETFLEYTDFDNTPSTRSYPVHASDWQTGDPQWQGANGREIIGVVNYLSAQEMNVHYFLTMNISGDGKDAYPYVSDTDFSTFDVSKLSQWGIVFDHMMKEGIMPEFVLTENENQSIFEDDEGVVGGFADSRKLYYREMVARFGYLNAVVWNIGEEIAWATVGGPEREPLTTQQQINFATYLKGLLPIQSQLISIHNGPSTDDSIYNGLLGNPSYNSISYQGNYNNDFYGHDRILSWINSSNSSGNPWVVRYTEPFSSSTNPNLAIWRQESLWASLMAGSAGVQYYDGGGSDLSVQDYSVNDPFWSSMRIANEFFVNNNIPFQEMSSADSDVSDGWMLAKPNEAYVVYLVNGGVNPTVNFGNPGISYSIKWYDPRNGGALQDGTIIDITSTGSPQNIGLPPNNTSTDWVAYLATENSSNCEADYEEVNGLVVIEAENFPLVSGWIIENTETPFTGNGYINWTGGTSFNTPGNGTISATIKINNPGTYLVEWRSKINGSSSTDDNDTWLRFNDASEFYAIDGSSTIFPYGSGQTPNPNGAGADNWFKVYTNSINWSWQTRTSDNDPHQIYVDFDSPGIYTIELSGRSENHLIDRIVLSAAGNQDLGVSETACDDGEPTTGTISIDNSTVEEGNNAVFSVTLNNAISGGFTVDYATSNGTAIAGQDYSSTSGTLTFTGTTGEVQQITVPTADDSTIESTEQFFVNLSNVSSGSVSISDGEGVGNINDNDFASLTIDNVTIDEGNNAVFTVTLDNNVSGGFNLDFATADDSALSPADYTTDSGTLSFTGNAGETQTISISTNDDSVVEGSEQFFINLSNPTNGVTLADSQGTATITDNDSSSLSINDVSVTEGGTATLTVSLSNAVNGGISVNYATTDNSAQAGTDYQSQSNTLNFVGTAGESRQISIATLDDFDVEFIEDFTVDLSNITGTLSASVSFADNSGLVTVNDNDSAEIEISNTSAIEGSNLIFNVSLNHNVDGGVSVDYTTADITAVSGSDYTAQSNTLNFAGLQGETLQISVPTLTDGLVESSEQISVTLSNSSNPNVTFLIDTGTGTIVDSDTASVFINDNTTVNENDGQAVFTITLSAEVSGGFTIDVQTQDGTAVAGGDYTATSNTITFTGTAGETQQFSVPITDDAELESNEQFQVLLSNISNSSVQVSNGTATGVILDNDTASLSINSVTVTEGSPAVFNVTLNSAVATPFTVSYTTLAGTAFAGEDFESSTGTLNFSGSANETQTISVNTIDDAVVESTENFVVELSNVQGAAVTISGNQGTATITDNDTAAAISINDVSITEGGNAVFTVTLDNAVSGGLTVDFATADNSATAPADYSSNSGTLTFSGNAGETQTITITTVDDTEVESNEQFFVNLSNATNGVTIADNQGIATLTDNDAAASVSIDDISITEGNNAVFTVTLNNDVSGGFSLDFATADDSALAPADYNAGSGTLSFTGNAGETQTITITTIDDIELESNEQFFVNLTNATNGVTIADNQGVAVINDNEEENPVAPELSIQETAAEEGTIMVVPVSLNQAATEIIELEIIFENITTTDTDFETSPVTVLFEVGQISSEIRIPVFNDGENEEIETFRILVGSVLQGEILNPEVEGIASILDQPELIVYPVPLIDNQIPLSLTGMGNGTFFLLVMESSGKTLISQVVEISENQYEINLPSTLANGIYLLNLQNADTGTEYSKKFALNR